MELLMVVEAEPVADAGSRLRHAPVVVQIDLFVFQRAPQPLNKDVVHVAPAAIHADRHAALGQHAGELVGRELRTPIAVEDLRPPLPQRPLQCLQADGLDQSKPKGS